MNLTAQQLTTLATDINGRAAIAPLVAIQNWPAVANFYNTTAAPVVNVWLTSVPVMPTLNSAIHWSDFNLLSALLQGSYMAMTQSGSVNMAEKNVARGLVGLSGQVPATDGIFVDGSTSSVAIRAASIRPATYFEALFSALGTGTLLTANVCQSDALGNSFFGQRVDDVTVDLAMTGA
jgi:hypothetical protein